MLKDVLEVTEVTERAQNQDRKVLASSQLSLSTRWSPVLEVQLHHWTIVWNKFKASASSFLLIACKLTTCISKPCLSAICYPGRFSDTRHLPPAITGHLPMCLSYPKQKKQSTSLFILSSTIPDSQHTFLQTFWNKYPPAFSNSSLLRYMNPWKYRLPSLDSSKGINFQTVIFCMCTFLKWPENSPTQCGI